jgi:1-acyl-sn-glycerol-3-phosphate acyltransferase
MLAYLRSVAHFVWMILTVVPYALAILVMAPFARPITLYRIAQAWLAQVMYGLRTICGVQWRVHGMENLPVGETSPGILLVKHQSTLETFLMPVLMPHPLAYVFKRELLYIPFFGWAMGRLDMVHIDRSQRAQAFNKVVAQGKRLLAQGIWVIMFPEGTRIPRGEQGVYKSGGTRLAVATGAPVIPVAVTSSRCWPRKSFIKHPGMVEISIGQPIPSAGRGADELMREVEAWIEAEMRRLDPEAYAREDNRQPAQV